MHRGDGYDLAKGRAHPPTVYRPPCTVGGMRITVANLKGGAGKTTTAVALATLLHIQEPAGALLADADPQGSATAWADDATEDGTPLLVPVVGMASRQIGPSLRAVEAGRHAVIDTPPGELAIVTSAITVADVVVIPARPTLADLQRLAVTLDLAVNLNTPAVVLLTQTRAGTKSLEEARDAIEHLDYPAFDAHIPLRESVAASFGQGGRLDQLTEFYAPMLTELRAAMETPTEGVAANV